MRLRDVPGQGHQQTDGVLGCRDDVRLGRVRDHDPPARRGLDIDVVDPHSSPPDDLQVGRPVDDLGGHLGRGADDQRVVAGDDVEQRRIGVDVDVEALRTKQLDACLGDRLADEYLHG